MGQLLLAMAFYTLNSPNVTLILQPLRTSHLNATGDIPSTHMHSWLLTNVTLLRTSRRKAHFRKTRAVVLNVCFLINSFLNVTFTLAMSLMSPTWHMNVTACQHECHTACQIPECHTACQLPECHCMSTWMSHSMSTTWMSLHVNMNVTACQHECHTACQHECHTACQLPECHCMSTWMSHSMSTTWMSLHVNYLNVTICISTMLYLVYARAYWEARDVTQFAMWTA